MLKKIQAVARTGRIFFTGHAIQRMIERGIMDDAVREILTSSTTQLIESQPPSSEPGREHADTRYLLYDPSNGDVIVICAVCGNPPTVRVITAEYVDYDVWDTQPEENPALIRK